MLSSRQIFEDNIRPADPDPLLRPNKIPANFLSEQLAEFLISCYFPKQENNE